MATARDDDDDDDAGDDLRLVSLAPPPPLAAAVVVDANDAEKKTREDEMTEETNSPPPADEEVAPVDAAAVDAVVRAHADAQEADWLDRKLYAWARARETTDISLDSDDSTTRERSIPDVRGFLQSFFL